MTLDHVAIWTPDLERLKDYYTRYFHGSANQKYINPVTLFESYFLTFPSGSRIEIMQMPGVPDNLNDTVRQHMGIIHMAFGVDTDDEVISKLEELEKAGYRILRGPRKTGDGYFEFETLDPDNNRIEVTTVVKAG